MLIDKNLGNKQPLISKLLQNTLGTNNTEMLRVSGDNNLFYDTDTNDVEGLPLVGQANLQGNGKSEKFQDVFDEMSRNIPDSTSTIKEKQSAIKYIDRMLACNDITPELKTYWQNKKEIIKQEIVRIENENKAGTGEKQNDIWNEFDEFVNKFSKTIDKSLSPEDRKEYYDTFNSTCITYYMRLLASSDLTPDMCTEYMRSIFNHISDMQKF